MPRRSLSGKRVIITGASSGIGYELARQLSKEKCRLAINARRADRLQELEQTIRDAGSEVIHVAGDICDPAVRNQLLEQTADKFGGIDILINNAGVGAIGEFIEADEERLRKVMEVNFFAPAELTRSALPFLKSGEQGLVVNISSVLGHRAVPMKSEYCASKFALHGLSDSLRAELADQGVDMLLVSPSTTDSEFFDSVLENSTGKSWKLSSAQSPEVVARKTISAIQRNKHEIILTWSGWGLVWLDRLFPSIANRMVARFGKSPK